jgi:predicted nuclease of predicted toxin-antitoxin system
MRILLDENLDWRLSRSLPGHDVQSVPLIGWAGTKNGALLARASGLFELFVTMDNAMVQQHDFTKVPFIVVTLRARSNRLADTTPLMPRLLALLPTLRPGQVVVIE